MTKNLEKLSSSNQRRVVMPEIIRALRKLGGYATTREVKQELKENSLEIPESYMTYKKMSRNGQEYIPFNYAFNFSVTNLIFAGFLIRPVTGQVELTKLGRQFDLEKLDIDKDIMVKADAGWKKRHETNVAKTVEQPKPKKDPEITLQGVDPGDQWRDDLLTAIGKFSPAKFELFARLLVKEMGVELDDNIGTKLTGDGGLDGFGYLTTDDFRTARVAIQAKRWTGMVPSPEIDKFRGAMDKYNAEFGIFVTNSDFTRDAVAAARVGTRVITLINGQKLTNLVAKKGIYVKPVITYELGDYYGETE